MDQDTYDRGLAMRKKVLGDAYVDRALKGADNFSRDFQRLALNTAGAKLGAMTR